MARIAECNSDTDGNDEVASADIKRTNELLLDAFSHLHGIRLIGELQQDDEFVAAKSPDSIVAAHAGLHAFGHFDQQLIAGQMPEAVVDQLEVVEVQKQDPNA